ncbi:MAG TPA: hypothetical protein DCZ94_19365 [Lentisphaeria bacterium]|nr:MAG: hypothetical protein A2X48_15125 [Lentisphaerae bacterium GWF2_49_21]HBC89104.1 hypothetical protein [Lentisphaeria bacterium]
MKTSSYIFAAIALLGAIATDAAPVYFPNELVYFKSSPVAGKNDICNWKGALFDAENIGGSGVNADGGADNGTANDEFTYVTANRPPQGQTFVTGNEANGYELSSITIQAAGYADNKATDKNFSPWDLRFHNGPVLIKIFRLANGLKEELDAGAFLPVVFHGFMSGGKGNPGAGSSANGCGIFITFKLPVPVHLEANANYAFEVSVADPSGVHFEWLGTSSDSYPGGSAYNYNKEWRPVKLQGDRVFSLGFTITTGQKNFIHPGALHTQEDFDRMKAKVAAVEQPWLGSWELLLKSRYAQLNRNPRPFKEIIRGIPGNNYTPTQEDAVSAYQLALRYHVAGDKAFADKAVVILNAWPPVLKGLGGNSNVSLGAGICGLQFASAAEMLSTYPGWAEADKKAFKEMMMRVFYPAIFDFLWRHHGTFKNEGGNTHYRLNWDTSNMAAMLAIGVFCDNRAVYSQAIDYFKYGCGNGRIERACWYIHPDGMGQSEELGRDQGHNTCAWDFMARMCQIAWNQGDDLYSYDNNRFLRAIECNAKYNLGLDVPYVSHRNTMLKYTEGAASGSRAQGPTYEMVYNHYVNIKGIAAPYSQLMAEKGRPDGGPDTRAHPSQVDYLGFASLTFSRDPITKVVPPSGLMAQWGKGQVSLSWWGTAGATGYKVKRAAKTGGPYSVIGNTSQMETAFADKDVAAGKTYFYVVSAIVNGAETANSRELMVKQGLLVNCNFDNDTKDAVGNRHGTAHGSPEYAAGHNGGNSIKLDGTDDYVQLPAGIANCQEITVSAWVFWNGGKAWQRVFDFGSDIDKYMFLTPDDGSGKTRFSISTTRGYEDTGTLEGPALPSGKWVHVAVTLGGGTGKLYVDGLEVDSKTIDKVAPLFCQPYCYIGRSLWNNDPLFSGMIDDFRIYNYALSAEEIAKLAK